MSDFSNELRRLLAERGMSTYRVARNVPCDPSYISHLCNGAKRPSVKFIERLEEILDADGALAAVAPVPAARRQKLPPGKPVPMSLPSEGSWALPVCAAVLSPAEAARNAAVDGPPPTGKQLARAASAVCRASLASDYAAVTSRLPGLIGSGEFALFGISGEDDVMLRQVLSDIYSVAAWTLIKADAPSVAWTAAQRAVLLAEQADDGLRSSAATRCLAEVHMRAGSYEEAARTAFLAATYLDTVSSRRPAALSLRGAALLSASAAAARRGDSRESRTSLRAAAVVAERLGTERYDHGAVFGPVNVAIHRVVVPVELGAHREALRHVNAVPLGTLPAQLAERRSRFLIDAARAHAGAQDDQGAIGALAEAEAIAPDEVRHHRMTRSVVADLMTRDRRSSGLRELADRCGVTA